MWDPEQYGRFADHRSRPFADLTAQIQAQRPAYVVDLGCGSGELTARLARRGPEALVEGVDSSAEMIARAGDHAIPGRLSFAVADARSWQPAADVDVLVSNAVLQWVEGHDVLLRRWVGRLAPGGWLAIQVPGNFDAPSHLLLRQQVARWSGRLGGLTLRSDPVLDAAGYWSLLHETGARVQAWEATYLQLLTGPDPVLEWTKGTALRPVLAALAAQDEAEFLAEYAAALRLAYPAGPAGTLFPFRRIFAVAQAVR